jgi:glycosyltransferase involved in cell wall biosynthesis
MRILHLFSNWKWTGPADPVLNLCKGLAHRGHDVTLAYRKPPVPVEDSVERRVLKAGIKATDHFSLNHSLKPYQSSFYVSHLRDISALTGYFRREKFDILNVHHSHGHLIGGIAARRAGSPLIIIRTDHKREFLKPNMGNRILISRFTDGMITFSERARRADAEHFGVPPERIRKVSPALDLSRYHSSQKWKDMRAVFGIEAGDVVIGMVARFQKYRRTEVFLEAIKSVVKEFPKLKLLLVGRSSQIQESVVEPIKKLAIEPWVVLAGYRTEDYIDTLACMDIFVFLMPGSDGTARALREAMAMGKPVIVADRGMLPELVDHEVSGLVVKDTSDGLAQAVLRLLRIPELTESLGRVAYQKAHDEFRLDRQVEAVEQFYQEMIRLEKWK